MNSKRQSMDEERRELLDELVNVGIKFGQGANRTGETYPWTMDTREVLLTAPYIVWASNLLWTKIKEFKPEHIGGVTMAADPLTVGILFQAAMEGYQLKGYVIRKEPKERGMRKMIEGPPIMPGARVVLLDDIVNYGQTKQAAFEVLKSIGANIVAVGVLIDYERAGCRWIEAQSIPVVSLFKLSDLGMTVRPGVDNQTYRRLWMNELPPTTINFVASCGNETSVVQLADGSTTAFNRDNNILWSRPRRVSCGPERLHIICDQYLVADDSSKGKIEVLDLETGNSVWMHNYKNHRDAVPWITPNSVVIGCRHASSDILITDFFSGTPIDAPFATVRFTSTPCRHNSVLALGKPPDYGHSHIATFEALITSYIGVYPIAILADYSGAVFGYSVESGRVIWKRRITIGPVKVLLASSEYVYAGGDSKRLICINIDSGRVQWIVTLADPVTQGCWCYLGKVSCHTHQLVYLLCNQPGSWEGRSHHKVATG